jgi:membrane protein DedA with SNARE-associated domain
MHDLQHLIATYGPLAVFVGALIEGEAVVITAGFLAHRGLMSFPAAAFAAFLGAFASDQIAFVLGRRFADHPFVRRQRQRETFDWALRRLENNATAFILSFRFLVGLRTVSSVAVGVSRVPVAQFFFLNSIACAVWALVIAGIGYAFGQVAERLLGRFGAIEHDIAAAVALGIVAAIVVHLLRRRINRAA